MKQTSTLIQTIAQEIEKVRIEFQEKEPGEVLESYDGVIRISGLGKCQYQEMLNVIDDKDPKYKSAYALALNLEQDSIGAILLGNETEVKAGARVERTGRILEVPVGKGLIGRVINPLGQPLDGLGKIKIEQTRPMERNAPGVIAREPVNTPLQTGLKAIDSMIPIGRGQRELIIGDRQTGKTTIAIDTIINQRKTNVVCIYVAIGQKTAKVAKIKDLLEKEGAMEHTIIVQTSAADPVALWYLAPYAGCAIGEYFRDQGEDALIVYDDLSKHAWAYRQISLLLRRPPGREAYPGDIFYLHSRLLERAAKLNKDYGGGSLTALPIIETQAGDVSAYIPTNVISITDGQIYLESDLFYQGIRPAVNVGLSVSRVGGAAQIKAMKKVAGRLRLDIAQFRELQAFAQFSSDLDPETRSKIERGKRVVEVLKQPQHQTMPVECQVVVIYAVTNGYLDQIDLDKVREAENEIILHLRNNHPQILKNIQTSQDLDEETEKKLSSVLAELFPKEKQSEEKGN